MNMAVYWPVRSDGFCPTHAHLHTNQAEKGRIGLRRIECLNPGWQFCGPDRQWKAVDLPHTWNAIDGQDGGNDYWRGSCQYTRKFPLPAFDPEREQVYLEFRGVNSTADVSVNGRQVVHHDGGYSTFRRISPICWKRKICWK